MNNHFFNFFLESSKGLVPSHRVININGSNTDVDVGTFPETVSGLGSIYEFLAYDTGATNNGAQFLKITSSSANDTFNGTGANQLLIEGLDANFKEISETVVMNGTGFVTTTNPYLRLNSAQVVLAGSSEKNAGVITITNAADASHDLGKIRAGVSSLQQAVYSVPANHSAYVLEFQGSMSRSSSAGQAVLELITREPKTRATLGDNFVQFTQHVLSLQDDGSRTFSKPFALPIKVPQLSDIIVRCTYVSANNTSVSTSLAIILVNDGE